MSNKERLNIAIVGLGFGAEFIPLYQRHPNANMYAICQRDPKKLEKIRQINRFHTSAFAEMLKKLKDTKEGDGTLLDRSLIVYGSGNSDGNRHTHDNLPIILAGSGGGTLNPGRYTKLGGQPMSNLFLSMSDRMGVKVDRIGDSSGRIGVV